ncbi:MAG: hypothetical protein AVDCRST_MAG34-1431 [uncultured Nocardioidaceae bacterium]|uniref:Uncharacterized protein n=1 Tax=uncultured Nocardioidaceae bacterium TaxID=253824 RepID=A0A6J4L6W5_9ACTN|nr:MAG: hypothetical protein AVDCRST_MAG34-1431 [uncultured Nocardioidaceae bacterium]
MRRRTAAALALALVGSISACSDEGTALVSTDVDPVHATTLTTVDATLHIPPGSASGGTVTLGPATLPDDVPSGVEPLGPAAAVLLEGGSLTAPATISFPAPEGLRRGDVLAVVWRQPGGGWTWLPAAWQDRRRRLAAEFTEPTAGFLARVDTTAWLNGFVDEFVGRVSATSGAKPPSCADEAVDLDSGGDAGKQVRWCLGADDRGAVLKVTNDTRLYQEVSYPEGWQALGDALPVTGVNGLLGLEAPPEPGTAARLLAAGETVALRLPVGALTDDTGSTVPSEASEEQRAEVAAAVTVPAWALSSLVAGADVYREVAARIDGTAGKRVARAARGLPGLLERGPAGGPPTSPGVQDLHRCLSPVHGTSSLDRANAARILTTAFGCVPGVLRRTTAAVAEDPAADPAVDPALDRLVSRVGAETLEGLSTALESSPDAWAAVPGETGDSTFRIWLGEPPPQELDYTSAPLVFGVGDDVEAASPRDWTPELRSYLAERLELLAAGDPSSGCPTGSFAVRRVRSDGFALATQVDCDGEIHHVVLKRLEDGWHELDDAEVAGPADDALFDCDLMALHSVPAFVAGDSCLTGSESQDYP